MRQVIIADNQDISRLGLQHVINGIDAGIEILIVSGKRSLIDLLCVSSDAVVILDYTLLDFESANELIILNSRFEKSDWILFSDELSDEFLRTVLFGTQSVGVLMKDSSEDEIRTGIREAFKGNRYICSFVSNILLDNSRKATVDQYKHILTSTEEEILKEMALGKTTKEIAAKRFVSVHTIMTHRKNIFRKIEVNNIHEATKYAMRAGIVDMAEYYI
jgi:DNA-binding NarL/FixJ family response regulator